MSRSEQEFLSCMGTCDRCFIAGVGIRLAFVENRIGAMRLCRKCYEALGGDLTSKDSLRLTEQDLATPASRRS